MDRRKGRARRVETKPRPAPRTENATRSTEDDGKVGVAFVRTLKNVSLVDPVGTETHRLFTLSRPINFLGFGLTRVNTEYVVTESVKSLGGEGYTIILPCSVHGSAVGEVAFQSVYPDPVRALKDAGFHYRLRRDL